MRIGVITNQNKIWTPEDRTKWSLGSHSQSVIQQLALDDISVEIHYENPDFSLFDNLDVVYYLSGTGGDGHVVKYFADIPCKTVINPDGGCGWLSRWSVECVENLIQLMDMADLVVLYDKRRYEAVCYSGLTNTPLFVWRWPYPVKRILKVLETDNDAPQYDIILPYGPQRSINTRRNGHFAAMAAQRIVDDVDGFNTIGVFNWHSPLRTDLVEQHSKMLRMFGCHSFELIPIVNPARFVQTVSKAKMVINLDMEVSLGRVAVDSAIAKTPYIGTGNSGSVYYLYHDIYIQEPFDVVSPVGIANEIAKGRWCQDWIDRAYGRAYALNMEDSAYQFEKILRSL